MKKSVLVRDRQVLITGAASGIGRSLASLLLNSYNCRLTLVDKDEQGLAEWSDGVKKEGFQNRFTTHVLDLSDPTAVTEFIHKLAPAAIDILINNAGVFYAGTFAGMTMNDFKRVIEINLMAPVRLTHGLMERLGRSDFPVIVNVSSLAGLVGGPGMVAYSTSKFGLVGFAEALVGELPEKFHVCTVCPSFVKTGIVRNGSASESVPSEEKGTWFSRMDKFLNLTGKDPEKVARSIVNAIEKKKSFALINPDAHLLHITKRILPNLTGRVVGATYQHLKRKGIVRDEH
jgi:short-subunit dehydrogenase